MAYNILGKILENNKEEYKEIYLSPYDVIPSKDNHYSMDEIEQLADTFIEFGQQQPIVLGKVEDEFIICSGHRRNRANIYNIEQGRKPKDYKIKYLYKDMTERMLKIELHIGNLFNRKITSYEEMEGLNVLKEEYEAAAAAGEIKIEGGIRRYLSEKTGIKETTIAEYNKIDSSLIEEGKQAFKEGEINKTSAYRLSQIPAEEQKTIIETTKTTEREIRNKEISERVKEQKEKAAEEEERIPGQDNILNHSEWCPNDMSDYDTENAESMINPKDDKEQYQLNLDEVVEEREHVFEQLRSNELTVYLFKEKKLDGTYLKIGDEYYIFPEDRSEFIKVKIICLLEHNDGLIAGYVAAGIKKIK